MKKLSKKQREEILGYLQAGQDIPDDYKNVLFPPEKKEYELVYDGKDREEDIIADTWGVPLQKIKTFNLPKNTSCPEWTNRLIFGDNLQVMKRLLDDPQVKGKVRLVYIDPPFATKQDFQGSQDQKAYQDKVTGARFVESLRKRLLLLRELLSSDGVIYVHLDWRKCHYMRIILDEIFGEMNFQNEIIWHYGGRMMHKVSQYNRKHDVILFYSKSNNFSFTLPMDKVDFDEYAKARHEKIHTDANGKRYLLAPDAEMDRTIRQYEEDIISKGRAVDDVWNIRYIRGNAYERQGYPTQKPEALLERLIKASSNDGDLILDAFAGAGTTPAVAEKLNRRWIGIDSSKLSIYTIQRRLLNLKEGIGHKGNSLKASPFTLYNAGLYDFKRMRELPWDDYRLFALQLFQVRNEEHQLSGIQLDGFKDDADVLVFNFKEHKDIVLDEGYIKNLHSHLKGKTRSEFYIIAPASRVTFLEDYIDLGKTRYYILRIPYSIIDELHSRPFQEIHQPADETEINNTVEAVGFDFIMLPKVKAEYSYENRKGELLKSACIEIKDFTSQAMTRKPKSFENKETLSMLMVDYDYTGNGDDVFDLDVAFYRDDIEKNDWKIYLDDSQFGNKVMIIYLDIFGNELREVKTPTDFGIKTTSKKKTTKTKTTKKKATKKKATKRTRSK